MCNCGCGCGCKRRCNEACEERVERTPVRSQREIAVDRAIRELGENRCSQNSCSRKCGCSRSCCR